MRNKFLLSFSASFIVVLIAAVVIAGVSASDRTDNAYLKRSFTLRSESVSVAEGGTGTNGFGGTKIFNFKEGRVLVHGVVCNMTVSISTNLVNNGSGINLAFGTATAIATTGAVVHTSTRADLCANVESDPWTNGVTKFQSQLAASAQFDGTSAAKDMYVNLLVDDADITNNVTATVDGTVEVTFSILGDY